MNHVYMHTRRIASQAASVTPQNLLQGHDGHFIPQAQRLKVETTQTFIL